MEKKNIDWSNLGFGYIKTDYRYVSNYKDGSWDEGTGLRQLPLHKTSCKIAGSRLNSGFFIAKTCQFFEKYLLYVLCGVVLYGIILV